MAVHDTLGDFITIIRNGNRAGKEHCTARYSKMREAIAHILQDEGYISRVTTGTDERGFKTLELTLKFVQNTPAIRDIQRHSTPGCRLYYGYGEIPRVLGGLGVAILTTSKGVMRAREARKNRVGGELVCQVW